MTGGSYVLKVRLDEESVIDVGSLRAVKFETGWYAYVGSSRTTNFTRIERHAELSRGENQTRHWHIDYLLGLNKSELIGSYTTNADVECSIAKSTDLTGVEDFGCSDCDCDTHLYFTDNEAEFDDELSESFQELGEKYEYILADG